jgi:Ca2+-binding RTX toxin-like protein
LHRRLVVIGTAWLLAAVLAACTPTATPDHRLREIRVVGDDIANDLGPERAPVDDHLSVECTTHGRVLINGHRPTGGPIACTEVVSILVVGGVGDDHIALSDIGPSEFRSMRSVRVDTGGGNDSIYGSALGDVIVAGAGNDVIVGDVLNDDVVDGGEGSDRVEASLSSGTLRLTSYTSVESAVVDTLNDALVDARGFSGELEVNAGDGDDTILGGLGRNDVNGGRGNDHIVGGPDKDRLQGGNGHDDIDGKGGNDFFYDTVGADDVRGGRGHDRFFVVFPRPGRGNRFDGGSGRDLIHVLVGGDIRLSSNVLVVPDARARVLSFERAGTVARTGFWQYDD